MVDIIRVIIVDDHQSIIDGYLYRLQLAGDIEVVGTAHYGEEIGPLLEKRNADLLLLDANIPTSASNLSPYPVLFYLPQLLEAYPDLQILIISMYNKRSFIEFALEAGISGYILKDDYEAVESLPKVLRSVVEGSLYLSSDAFVPPAVDTMEKPILTPRQLQALTLSIAYPNETTADLARRMAIKNSTLRNLLSQTYLRLGVRNRSAAIVEARRLGLILPP